MAAGRPGEHAGAGRGRVAGELVQLDLARQMRDLRVSVQAIGGEVAGSGGSDLVGQLDGLRGSVRGLQGRVGPGGGDGAGRAGGADQAGQTQTGEGGSGEGGETADRRRGGPAVVWGEGIRQGGAVPSGGESAGGGNSEMAMLRERMEQLGRELEDMRREQAYRGVREQNRRGEGATTGSRASTTGCVPAARSPGRGRAWRGHLPWVMFCISASSARGSGTRWRLGTRGPWGRRGERGPLRSCFGGRLERRRCGT